MPILNNYHFKSLWIDLKKTFNQKNTLFHSDFFYLCLYHLQFQVFVDKSTKTIN